MARDDLIELDVAILMLRYGENALIRQLAEAMQLSEAELRQRISSLRASKAVKVKTRKTVFSVEKLAEEHADVSQQLLDLDARYENRTFLSELKDVKRFLERTGGSVPPLKSRQDAKKKVFQALAKMSSSQLDGFREEVVSQSRGSSLGVISDHILGRKKE